MIYLLDANTISDLIVSHPPVVQHFNAAILARHTIGICQPVYYELMRGLFWRTASRKMNTLNSVIIPRLEWIPLLEEDWLQAARFWARAVSRGKQLSDIDLLLVAIAFREDAIIVSNDTDFDVLPIQRVDWRQSIH